MTKVMRQKKRNSFANDRKEKAPFLLKQQKRGALARYHSYLYLKEHTQRWK